jgi:hypothetical protein
MINHIPYKTLEPTVVTKNSAGLIKGGVAIKFYPALVDYLKVNVTTAVIACQMFYILDNPMKTSDGGIYNFSLDTFATKHFPWVGRRQIVRAIASLSEYITVKTKEGCKNSYSLTTKAINLIQRIKKEQWIFLVVYAPLVKSFSNSEDGLGATALLQAIIANRIHMLNQAVVEQGYIERSYLDLYQKNFHFVSWSTYMKAMKALKTRKVLIQGNHEGVGSESAKHKLTSVWSIDHMYLQKTYLPLLKPVVNAKNGTLYYQYTTEKKVDYEKVVELAY